MPVLKLLPHASWRKLLKRLKNLKPKYQKDNLHSIKLLGSVQYPFLGMKTRTRTILITSEQFWWSKLKHVMNSHQVTKSIKGRKILSLPPPLIGPNVQFPLQFCANFSRFLQAHSSCIYLCVLCFFFVSHRKQEVENMDDVMLCWGLPFQTLNLAHTHVLSKHQSLNSYWNLADNHCVTVVINLATAGTVWMPSKLFLHS